MLLFTWKTVKAKRKGLQSCGEYLDICIQSKGGKHKLSLSKRAILLDPFFFFFIFLSIDTVYARDNKDFRATQLYLNLYSLQALSQLFEDFR